MSVRTFTSMAVLVVALFVFVPASYAGPYGDALGKCLVSSSSPADKTILVRWMFATMSLHPDVKDLAPMAPGQRSAIIKESAELFQRLLTDACASEAKDAVRYEGAATVEASFSLLGQVAARELFVHPSVADGLAEFSNHIDGQKLRAVLESQQ